MLRIIKGDITQLPFKVDCVVNSANPSLSGAAGQRGVWGHLCQGGSPIGPSGGSVRPETTLTPGFQLAPWIIHVVIPRYDYTANMDVTIQPPIDASWI